MRLPNLFLAFCRDVEWGGWKSTMFSANFFRIQSRRTGNLQPQRAQSEQGRKEIRQASVRNKSRCRQPQLLLASFGFGEPAATEPFFGDAGEIRLDIEDGGAVKHVDTADLENVTFAAQQFDRGERNGVGAEG